MNKPFYKRGIFWIVIIVVLIIIGFFADSSDNNTVNPEETNNSEISYTLTGETLGEYGKKITLNKDTDMPVEKYLYKLPAGSYVITTSEDKTVAFNIVKDKIITNKDEKYPEELDYVENNLIKQNEKKTITLKDDESIQIIGKSTIKIEKVAK